MVGYGANKGIVPISCEEIFKRIKKNPDSQLSILIDDIMISLWSISEYAWNIQWKGIRSTCTCS